MKLAHSLTILLAIAAPACAKQGQVREPATPDLFHLCNDARTRSLCTPAPGAEQPVRVDTNLAGPRSSLFRV